MREPGGQWILLVTNEVDLARVVGGLLEAEGYRVELCPDAHQALLLYQMDPCSAVLFDLALVGEMSAHALCHALRELSTRVVLVGISRRPASEVDEEVLRLLGADTLLASGFTTNQILGALHQARGLRAGGVKTAYHVACAACGTSHRARADALARRHWRAHCPNCNNLFRVDPEGAMCVPMAVDPAAALRGRVLVVDDARLFRLFLYDLLSEAGYRAVLAEDGRQGLDLARRWRPDVAVVDVTMPGMDGLELLRRLKAGPVPDRPAVLVMTSFTAPEYRQAAEEAGADGYVLKPIAVEPFLGQVSRLVQRNGALASL